MKKYLIRNSDSALALTIFVCTLQLFYWPFFLNNNGTAKLFLFLLGTPFFGLIFLKHIQLYIPWAVVGASGCLFWVLISAHQSNNYHESLYSLGYVFLGVLFIMIWTNLDHGKAGSFDIFFSFFLLLIIFSAALGLLQYLTHLLVPSINMVIPHLLPPSMTRISGPYGQPNLFSLLLLVGLLALFCQYIYSAPEIIDNWLLRLRMVPVGLVSVVFFLTESRSGFVAFCGVALCLFFAFRAGWLCKAKKSQHECLLFVVTLAFSYFLAQIILQTDFIFWVFDLQREVLALNPDGRGLSVDARLVFYASAIWMFLDNPFFGVGLGQFKNHLPEYQALSHDLLGFVEYEAIVYAKWAHNEFLQLLAEGGFFLGLSMIVGLVFFGKRLWGIIRFGGTKKCLFSHLAIVLFLFVSMFSWPLHYPPLFVLFLVLLAFSLPANNGFTLTLTPGLKVTTLALLLGIFIVGSHLFLLETKVGKLGHSIGDKASLDSKIDEFAALAEKPYSEYVVLVKVFPQLMAIAFKDEDIAAVERLLPFSERLVAMEGSYWQWYNLARCYLFLDRDQDARVATMKAIDLKPDYELPWSLLHHINIRKKARATGRTVEELLSLPSNESSGPNLKEFLKLNDPIKLNI